MAKSKKQMPQFHFANGFKVSGISAQDLGEHLLDLKQQLGGTLTAPDVVDDAKSPASPIHNQFEWNVTAAAQKHWEETARKLMRSVIVYMPRKPKAAPEPVRILVHVETSKNQGYIGIKSAMTDAENAAYVVRKALRELRGWRKRYGMYKDLQKVCNAIDNALK